VASIIDTVANLAKRRGFVFQAGEIYGGTKSAWDYGPLGVELKENIKRQWWRAVVTSRDDVVGIEPMTAPTDSLRRGSYRYAVPGKPETVRFSITVT